MSEYMTGFGNEFATEALAGALPEGRNSPQRPAFGLYAEQFSGTAFTMARHENRRSWLYRLRPSAMHGRWEKMPLSAPDWQVTPNRLRWSPRAMAEGGVEFFDSLIPVLDNGDAAALSGVEFASWSASKAEARRIYMNSDGEWLFIPYAGRLTLLTEMGRIEIEPQQVAIIPRGLKFRIEFPDGHSAGYLIENKGAPFRLPDLGPIGSNGLANARDFETPKAWYEDADGAHQLIQKYARQYWALTIDHSPLDVVAWHGNLAPYRYDLRRFNTLGTISYDHPDPSIFTVLTSPSDTPGRANADFVIFPPRWMVGEDTFRPPWFHRNIMSEAMGLIHGEYDAKQGGFAPGAISLHNCMNAHGPDAASWKKASEAQLKPEKIENTMAFMVESCWPYRVAGDMLDQAQGDYDSVWDGFPKADVK